MNTLIAALHNGRNGDDFVVGLLICILIAVLIGGVVYAVVKYGFKQAWAGAAGAGAFCVALLLCLIGD